MPDRLRRAVRPIRRAAALLLARAALLTVLPAVLLAACAEDDTAQSEPTPPAQSESQPADEPQQQAEPSPAQQAPPPAEEPPPDQPRDGLPFAEDAELLARLRIEPESDGDVDYDRDTYLPGGWGDADGDGCNTREEVLIAEARGITAVNQWCRPLDGSWWSWYDEIEFDDPGDLDIDHMVPLFEAHHSGAWRWPELRRVEFANDLDEPAALTAVSARSNRAKSADDPAEWRPPSRSAWCQYARDWITVKTRWALTADPAEAAALQTMLQTCKTSPDERPPERLNHPVQRIEIEPPEEQAQSSNAPSELRATYESCEAAESAGEPRIQGQRGTGQGFPAQKVPSARDGDEDGVVCER